MMKSIYLLLALAFTLHLSAQDLSMITGNPQWNYGCYHNNGELYEIAPTHKIEGSFEANGKTYHKLYQIDYLFVDNGAAAFLECLINPVGIREENGKVYAYYKNYESVINDLKKYGHIKTEALPYQQYEDEELLLYDFTLKVGDQYPTSEEYGTLIVSNVETVKTADSVERKLFTLSNGFKILEGVGCLNTDDVVFYLHDHYTYMEYIGWPSDRFYYELYQYTQNGNIVYENNGDNPLSVKENRFTTPVVNCLYDLQGRCLRSQPTKGLYIQNGRKVVVK